MAVLMREAIGDSLRRARTARRRTLRDVSRKARVSLGYLSEVERGRKEASSELLAAICEALDIALHELLDRGGRGAGRRGAAGRGPLPRSGRPAAHGPAAGHRRRDSVPLSTPLPTVLPLAPAEPRPVPSRSPQPVVRVARSAGAAAVAGSRA